MDEPDQIPEQHGAEAGYQAHDQREQRQADQPHARNTAIQGTHRRIHRLGRSPGCVAFMGGLRTSEKDRGRLNRRHNCETEPSYPPLHIPVQWLLHRRPDFNCRALLSWKLALSSQTIMREITDLGPLFPQGMMVRLIPAE